jgi:hypothetical protein
MAGKHTLTPAWRRRARTLQRRAALWTALSLAAGLMLLRAAS